MITDILVPRIDVKMLREQREELAITFCITQEGTKEYDALHGLLNMVDTMIDIAEGVSHG